LERGYECRRLSRLDRLEKGVITVWRYEVKVIDNLVLGSVDPVKVFTGISKLGLVLVRLVAFPLARR